MNIYSHLYTEIFIDNKYTKWYLSIILNAINQNRKKSKTTYFEKHHIIPECIFKERKRKGPKGHLHGNPNHKTNLVLLTGREHFLCHLLLRKMMFIEQYIKNMSFAAWAMTTLNNDIQNRTIISSKIYATLRQEISEEMSILYTGRPQQNIEWKGKHHTEDIKNYLSEVKIKYYIDNPDKKICCGSKTRGKTFEEAFGEEQASIMRSVCKENNNGENNPMYGKRHREDSIDKIKAAREKQTIANRQKPNNRKFCDYCQQEYQLNNYEKYHGIKCKKYVGPALIIGKI